MQASFLSAVGRDIVEKHPSVIGAKNRSLAFFYNVLRAAHR